MAILRYDLKNPNHSGAYFATEIYARRTLCRPFVEEVLGTAPEQVTLTITDRAPDSMDSNTRQITVTLDGYIQHDYRIGVYGRDFYAFLSYAIQEAFFPEGTKQYSQRRTLYFRVQPAEHTPVSSDTTK